MSARHTRWMQAPSVAGALLLALAAAACGGGAHEARPDAGPSPGATGEAREAPRDTEAPAEGARSSGPRSAEELEAIYRARTDSARMRFTEADVTFMQGMIVHHGQALVMAALVPERTASRQIRILAARIDNGQKDEIATMQRWLRDRGQASPEVAVDGAALVVTWPEDAHGAHGEHRDGAHGEHGPEGAHAPAMAHHAPEDLHRHMAGMLSPEQLRELRDASGAEFDRLFLAYMIDHHQGAVEMVHELFAQDGAAQDESVFRIASDIQVDQRTEIARMGRMLESLSASDNAG